MKHVTFHLPSFLRRVRIHGGEFDSSARAMNRVKQVRLLQAEPRIVRGSTIERKQMSTKTTFKRIALVAVAALGFGMLTVAPSSATNTVLKFVDGGDGMGTDVRTGYGIAGAFNFVNLSADSWSATAGNDYVVTTDGTFGTVASGATVASDRKSFVASQAQTTFQVMTPTVGTVTVNYWKRTAGVLAAAAFETVVVTVTATKQKGTFSAANSTSIINSGETIVATADATVTGVATANIETATATIVVSLADALKLAMNDTVTATVVAGGANVRTYSDSTTVTTNGVAGTVSSSALSANGKAYVSVFPNGIAGAAQIRISLSDGTVLATETVTFASTTVATLEATVVKKYVSSSSGTGAMTVVAKDSAGNVINGAVITATSGTTTAITATTASATTTAGKATFDLNAASATAAGASVITFKSGTATTTASITAAGVQATSLTIAASAPSANAGDKVTFTMTVANANGPLADGDYVNVFVSAPVTSNGATGAFATETITVKDGVATSSVFLPFVAGTYTSTWTLKGTKGGAATTNLAAALVGTEVEVAVVVANPGADAATDAANEARDAADAATDAALQAAEAADAATVAAQEASDAVAALSESVTALVAGLQAQIKSLAAVLARIAKKVKA
jgi:trimeric autotransporter adhesin